MFNFLYDISSHKINTSLYSSLVIVLSFGDNVMSPQSYSPQFLDTDVGEILMNCSSCFLVDVI